MGYPGIQDEQDVEDRSLRTSRTMYKMLNTERDTNHNNEEIMDSNQKGEGSDSLKPPMKEFDDIAEKRSSEHEKDDVPETEAEKDKRGTRGTSSTSSSLPVPSTNPLSLSSTTISAQRSCTFL